MDQKYFIIYNIYKIWVPDWREKNDFAREQQSFLKNNTYSLGWNVRSTSHKITKSVRYILIMYDRFFCFYVVGLVVSKVGLKMLAGL